MCTGNYCNETFWEMDRNKLVALEDNAGNWIGQNEETEAGNYLPNQYDFTCGITTKTSYIVGAEDTKIGEFPYLAALGIYNTAYGL